MLKNPTVLASIFTITTQLMLPPFACAQGLTSDPTTILRDADSDMQLRETIRTPSTSDEGLRTAALIRSYLTNRPYSLRDPEYMEQGWTLPFVVSFVDSYGLYDMMPLAETKALELSQKPLKELDLDGVLHTIETAHYYRKTKRSEISDKIFSNLTARLWPDYAPKDLSGLVLFGYYKHLSETGDKAGADKVLTAYKDLKLDNANSENPPNYYERDRQINCNLDWAPAVDAYKKIETGDFKKATEMTLKLIEEEQAKKATTAVALSRIINLAKTFAKRGETEQAENILGAILPLATKDQLVLTRLYILSELFTLRPSTVKGSTNYWVQLCSALKEVDNKTPISQRHYFEQTNIEQERIASIIFRTAIAYFFNDEPKKSLQVAEYCLANYPAMSHRICAQKSLVALFAARLKDSATITKYANQAIANNHGYDFEYTDILALAIGECAKQGNFDDGEYIAKRATAVGKYLSDHPAPDSNQYNWTGTPEQVAHNKAEQLKAELAAIRFKYGELLLKSRRFGEAEEVLSQVPSYGGELVDIGKAQIAVDLSKALEGQNKYSAAIDHLYEHAEGLNTLSVLDHLPEFMAAKPTLDATHQNTLVETVRRVAQGHSYKMIGTQSSCILNLMKAQAWPENVIASMSDIVKSSDSVEGKVNAAEVEQQDREQKDAAYNSALLSLSQGNLSALRSCGSNPLAEARYLCYPDLFKAGKFDELESMLKLAVKQMTENKDTWDREAKIEKCLLLEFYMTQQKFNEAIVVAKEILQAGMLTPGPLETNPIGVGSINIPEYKYIQDAITGLTVANHTTEAETLALQLLNVQKKWLGSKNESIWQTYQLLEQIAKDDKQIEKAKNFHAHVDAIANFYLGPKAYRGVIPIVQNQNYLNGSFGGAYTLKELYAANRGKYFEDLYAEKRERGGPACEPYISALEHLARYYWHNKKYDECSKLLKVKLQIIEERDGCYSSEQQMCLAEMACLAVSRGDKRRARELLAIAQRKSPLFDRPDTPELRMAYAAVLFKLGEREKARERARSAVILAQSRNLRHSYSPMFVIGKQILAGTDFEKDASSIIMSGGCLPRPEPDPGLFKLDKIR